MTQHLKTKTALGQALGQKARGELDGDDRPLAALEDANTAMALLFFSPIPVFP